MSDEWAHGAWRMGAGRMETIEHLNNGLTILEV